MIKWISKKKQINIKSTNKESHQHFKEQIKYT